MRLRIFLFSNALMVLVCKKERVRFSGLQQYNTNDLNIQLPSETVQGQGPRRGQSLQWRSDPSDIHV